MQTWSSVIERRVEPYVVVVRDNDGKLVGIAPYYQAQLRFLKVFRFRTLRFVADIATGAEYPDWIVDPEVEDEVCRAIAEALIEHGNDWDAIWLPKIAGWTGALERMTGSMRDAGLQVHVRCRQFSAFNLADSLSDYEAALPAKRRQQLRRTSRRVSSIDGVEFVRCTNLNQLDEFLEALFDLHQRRWQSVGIDGAFRRKPIEEAFYREFASIALENGWLGLFGLKQHGVFKAVQFGYIFGQTYHQLQEGFDPDFEQGVGNVLRHHAIDLCMADGVRSYDFLGGWTEHKRRWGAELRHGHDAFIGGRKLRSRLLFLREIWPSGRLIEQEGTVTQISGSAQE